MGYRNSYENRRSFNDLAKPNSKLNEENASSSKRQVVEKESVTKQNTNPYSRATGDKCYRCVEHGHRSNSCPRRRPVNMAEHGDESSDSIKEEDDDGICGPDGEEEDVQQTLVVRKILLTPRRDDSQRNAVFRTRCTILNQIFELIIDSGSCENIISRNLLVALKLPVEKHPEPYSIVWITNSTGIKVKERCRVPLSIGKYYKDEVTCDVVDMDACQLLFGRPWQFDLGAIHDGQKNIYQVSKDGKKITLLPLGFQHKTNPQKILTVTRSMREIMNDAQDTKEIHALVVKAVLEVGKTTKVPQVVQELLKEFQDLVPEELPAELPPMRNIQHAIDLVLGATLPNLPHYQMSPKE